MGPSSTDAGISFASSIAAVSERVEQGEGTLGRLVQDEALYTRVEESVAELKQTLSEVRRAAEFPTDLKSMSAERQFQHSQQFACRAVYGGLHG